MKKLIQGIVEFRKRVRPGVRESFAKLALGQSPDALLVACSDSRVAPNVFASTEPGDVFVVRNVGNLIAPCGSDGRSVSDESEAAAIEFASSSLRVADVIVCGHSDCGAMRALLEGGDDPATPHLRSWLRHGEPALRKLRGGARMNAELSPHNHLSQLNVLLQLEHLRTYPTVRERVDAGKLRLHAWWFDISEAQVLCYDEPSRRFVVIDEARAARLIERLEGRA